MSGRLSVSMTTMKDSYFFFFSLFSWMPIIVPSTWYVVWMNLFLAIGLIFLLFLTLDDFPLFSDIMVVFPLWFYFHFEIFFSICRVKFDTLLSVSYRQCFSGSISYKDENWGVLNGWWWVSWRWRELVNNFFKAHEESCITES